MKNILNILFVFLFLFVNCSAQDKQEEIRLLVRGDDIGSFHSANLACIESYRNGIMRSVEVMVPCPWFPEAVEMLNQNPGLDVGIHLVMTSEWSAMKWRPLTGISSITDENGYFFPMVWSNDNFPPSQAFRESSWKIEDVEKELRAQIETALKNIKSISHISGHMGFASADPAIKELVDRLSEEYGLSVETGDQSIKGLRIERKKNETKEMRAAAMADAILKLEPGTYLFVEHPAYNTSEMETVGHISYENVGADREGVTYMFTSEVVKEAVKKKNVRLISYRDLKQN